MSASTAAPFRAPRESWPLLLAAAAAAIYGLGHLGWYLQTPLGRVPVLDEREGINFANALVAGSVPAEPFYRAPGYALLLAGLRIGGVPAGGLFSAALFMGVFFHALTAVLAAQVARVWFDRRAAWIAGLLVAFNPVLVHFATQASDATPALACFLGGLVFVATEFAPRNTSPPRPTRWTGASVCWAAATILRPNYFLVWLVLPVLALVRGRHAPAANAPGPMAPQTRSRRVRVPLASLAGATLFAALGAWQQHVSGRFGFLPAQGAYNLWAANEPGANGRYFTQKVSLPAAIAEHNPTRAESLVLYHRETGRPAPDLAVVNTYWRARFIAYVTHHPLAWAGLLLRKTYALLNDWEQYNNETPAFHLARSPWLRWNPLSWGLLLVAGTAGAARLVKDAPRAAETLAWIATATAASCVLFFVSARFRLPLAALLTIMAGGALATPGFWRAWPAPRRIALAAACVTAALITFSNFDDVRDRSTFVQDHVLLARAAATTGDDRLAWHEAEAALALRPDHPDALRLAVASYFNLLLTNRASPADEPRWHDAAVRYLATNPAEADLRSAAAVALWRAGECQRALDEWRKLPAAPSALAARLLAHDSSASFADLLRANEAARAEPLVQLAMAVADSRSSRGSATSAQSLRTTAERLMPTRPSPSTP